MPDDPPPPQNRPKPRGTQAAQSRLGSRTRRARRSKRPAPRCAICADRAAAGIEANPLAALVGGIALGAIAGAFVPRSEQEGRLLAPVGQQLSDPPMTRSTPPRAPPVSEFDILGLTRDAARGQMSKVLEGVVGAVSSAGVAALDRGQGQGASG